MEQDERPVITFLSDFGLDGAAGICRGVMLSVCREAQIVDIAHTIRKYAVRDGGYLLRASLPWMPMGVHVAVVDPGVGTQRRPIALRVGRGDYLVGPDNGLLPPGAEALGGPVEARVLTNPAWWLPVTSSTFHGRDIFAPVAGHLAAGDAAFAELGEELALTDLVRLPQPEAEVVDGRLETVVTYVDSFGNLRLAGGLPHLERALGPMRHDQPLKVEFGAEGGAPLRETARFAATFGSVPAGAALLYVDSMGDLAFADNQGNAAARLGIGVDRAVRISAG